MAAYRIPTDGPESDGTLEWDATTLVLVRLSAGGRTGLGYTYADRSTALLVVEQIAPILRGREALDIPARFADMMAGIRNLGRPGLCAMAISAVDNALWDLKGKLLDASLADLLGTARETVAVYGSGGFTSYSIERLQSQLGRWAERGFSFVKMKVGRDPERDAERVARARQAIGPRVGLFVDANGAYGRKAALALAEEFACHGVSWFEEPVSSDDLEGLRLVRDRAPPGMAVSAGEYGYDAFYFRRMLQAGAVDVLQADATRCGGISGFMAAAGLAQAFGVPLSSHCAPALHCAPCCASAGVVHLEYFYDHARIESMFFDGACAPQKGMVAPDRSRPGIGLDLRAADAERFRI